MATEGRRRSTGERVLEGRHVIGLFILMLLFSGVFFTLGYVLGRGQFDGHVMASSNGAGHAMTPKENAADPAVDPSEALLTKTGNSTVKSAGPEEVPAPASSDWEFYGAGKSDKVNDRLRPAATAPRSVAVSAPARPAAQPHAAAPVVTSRPAAHRAPKMPAGSYVLQVAALTKEADAMELASNLQRKKFPAFVQSPGADRFYRVQVGPYANQKAAAQARKGLDSAGFKAIVKH